MVALRLVTIIPRLKDIPILNWRENMLDKKVLLVGAGGIGCEVLKNLALSGVREVHLVDFDTIEVSNLNRQFLYRKQDVGQSKAITAKNSVDKWNKNCSIISYHDDITSSKFDTSFFQSFDLVMNALDNRNARSHVNKMCVRTERPMIDGGTAGFLGQVTVCLKGRYECYDCVSHPVEKTYVACTIRNTPSELIHCIVWAKNVFSQCFGQACDDFVTVEVGKESTLDSSGNKSISDNSPEAINVRAERNSQKVFNKLFYDDIRMLLTLTALWEQRQPPKATKWPSIARDREHTFKNASWRHEAQTDLEFHCLQFENCFDRLRDMSVSENLNWDKDVDVMSDFVAAAACIRAMVFSIPVKSYFEIKTMAGNIIPAISTTNAMIAGMMMSEALKILSESKYCLSGVYILTKSNQKNYIHAPVKLLPPNPLCLVCSPKSSAVVSINFEKSTLGCVWNKVLTPTLGIQEAFIILDDGKGTMLYSTDPEDDLQKNLNSSIADFNIPSGSVLKVEDLLDDRKILIHLLNDTLLGENEFRLEKCELIPKIEKTITDSEVVINKVPETQNHSKNVFDDDILFDCSVDVSDPDDIVIDDVDSLSKSSSTDKPPSNVVDDVKPTKKRKYSRRPKLEHPATPTHSYSTRSSKRKKME